MLPAQFFLYLGSVMGAVQNAKTGFSDSCIGYGCVQHRNHFGGLASRVAARCHRVCSRFTGGRVRRVLHTAGCGRLAKWEPDSLRISILITPAFFMFVKLAIPIMLALSFVITDQWIIRLLVLSI